MHTHKLIEALDSRLRENDAFNSAMNDNSIDDFLIQFTHWATAQPDILAVALVGSHARNAARADSDVDLVIIARDPMPYLQNTAWAKQFGPIAQQQIEPYGWLTSLRVHYTDGKEVEYGLTDERWSALPLDTGSRRVISDGMRVLFEREPILSRHLL